MKYQLVLQFQASSAEDFDHLVAFEESLIEGLGDTATVDGHDFGSEEFNIFVLTDEPTETFERIKEIVTRQRPKFAMRAAYREIESEDFVILWPPNLKEFTVA